jgi:hypothetical protein
VFQSCSLPSLGAESLPVDHMRCRCRCRCRCHADGNPETRVLPCGLCVAACVPACLPACMHVCMYTCMHVCMSCQPITSAKSADSSIVGTQADRTQADRKATLEQAGKQAGDAMRQARQAAQIHMLTFTKKKKKNVPFVGGRRPPPTFQISILLVICERNLGYCSTVGDR